jgi:hypothetical protein
MQRIPFAEGESSQGRDKQAAHQNKSIGRPSYFNEEDQLFLRYTGQNTSFQYLEGMMCIDDCINAINTLRLRILRILRN